MVKSFFYATISLVLIETTTSTIPTLLIQNECFKDDNVMYTVNENSNYLLKWDKGTLISSDYCEVRFHAKGREVLDDYKVCFQTLDYSVEECEVNVKYHDATSTSLDTTYSCGNPPQNWCSGENDYAKIVVTGAHRAEKSSFSIQISGEKTYDYYNIVGGVTGGVITGVLVIAVVFTIVFYIRNIRSNKQKERKQSREQTRLDKIPESQNKGVSNMGYNDTEQKRPETGQLEKNKNDNAAKTKRHDRDSNQNVRSTSKKQTVEKADTDKQYPNNTKDIKTISTKQYPSDFTKKEGEIHKHNSKRQYNTKDSYGQDLVNTHRQEYVNTRKQNLPGHARMGNISINQHNKSDVTKEIQKGYNKKSDHHKSRNNEFKTDQQQNYGTPI